MSRFGKETGSNNSRSKSSSLGNRNCSSTSQINNSKDSRSRRCNISSRSINSSLSNRSYSNTSQIRNSRNSNIRSINRNSSQLKDSKSRLCNISRISQKNFSPLKLTHLTTRDFHQATEQTWHWLPAGSKDRRTISAHKYYKKTSCDGRTWIKVINPVNWAINNLGTHGWRKRGFCPMSPSSLKEKLHPSPPRRPPGGSLL